MSLDEKEQSYLSFPEYRGVSLSPSGKYAVVTTHFDNESFISIIDRATKKIKGSVKQGKNFHVTGYIWKGDDHIIIQARYSEGYLKGSDTAQLLFSVNSEGEDFRQIYPDNRKDLSKNFAARSLRIISDEIYKDRYLLMTENRFGIHSHQNRLSLIDIYNGKIKYLDKVDDMKNGTYAVDNSKKARLAVAQGKKESITFYTKNLQTGEWQKDNFFSTKSRPIRILGFSKNNDQFYFLGDNKKTMSSLYVANISKTGKVSGLREVFSYPKGDILNVTWDEKASKPLFVEYGAGRPKRKYLSNSQRAQYLKQLSQSFKDELVYMGELAGDDYLVQIRSDYRPTTFYIFNQEKKTVDEFLSTNENIRGLSTVKSQPVEYKTRDGHTIYGFLFKPKQWTVDTPMIINIHGGPYGVQDQWRFNGDVQFLVSRGYSVMNVNYRGSGGRGHKFEKLGYGKPGTTMQNDIADAAIWASKNNVARKGNVCLWGVSYGAYASIMSVMKFPELFKCGIGFGGVYDWRTIVEQGDAAGNDYAEYFWKKRLPKTDKEKFKHSPVSLAKDLKREVYIMHGKEDVRCSVKQARALKEELKKYKKDFKYQEFPDIGHWFVSDQDQKYQAYSEISKFLDRKLKNEKNVN